MVSMYIVMIYNVVLMICNKHNDERALRFSPHIFTCLFSCDLTSFSVCRLVSLSVFVCSCVCIHLQGVPEKCYMITASAAKLWFLSAFFDQVFNSHINVNTTVWCMWRSLCPESLQFCIEALPCFFRHSNRSEPLVLESAMITSDPEVSK